jgi:hypothetical protein
VLAKCRLFWGYETQKGKQECVGELQIQGRKNNVLKCPGTKKKNTTSECHEDVGFTSFLPRKLVQAVTLLAPLIFSEQVLSCKSQLTIRSPTQIFLHCYVTQLHFNGLFSWNAVKFFSTPFLIKQLFDRYEPALSEHLKERQADCHRVLCLYMRQRLLVPII